MSKFSFGRKRTTSFLVLVSFLAAQLCFLLLPGIFEPWNSRLVDQLFLLRYAFQGLRPKYDGSVVHIDINNTSLHKLNEFYLNRTHFAQVVRNLAAMNTSDQVFDVIFAARMNEKEDSALAQATREAGNVYYGMAFTLSEGETARRSDAQPAEIEGYLDAMKWRVRVKGDASSLYQGTRPLITFPDLASASKGLGYLNIKQDRDGIFRRAPLLIRHEGAFYPSIPFRVACDYLGVKPAAIVLIPGESITLKGARLPGKEARDIVVPIDEHASMIINFVGPWGCMKHYNFADIYHASEDRDEMELWKEELSGKIVLISDVATGSADLGPAPTDLNFPLGGLHSSVINTILSGQFLKEVSGARALAIEMMFLVLVLIISLGLSSAAYFITAAAAAVGYVLMAAGFFLFRGEILHIIRPVFFIAFATAAVTSHRYFLEGREKALLRQTFEAYFPPSVVRKIIANPEIISAKGEKKELTILFSDIKDFTAHSSNLSPNQIRGCLNEYFEAMVEIVFSHEGTVDKYIGDGLMVFFGDPDPQPDHAVRCVRAAIDMQRKVDQLRAKWEREGGFPIRIRIGVNSGEVVVGNMGSSRRLSYTVLGSAVNLAQRLEASAPVGGILVSQRTYELVKNQVEARPMGAIEIKGIDGPVSVYEIPVNGSRP